MSENLTTAFKALSDPTRRHILKVLQEGDLSAGELADHFEMSKPSVSHHLNLLKQADFVQSTRDGQRQIYSINTTVLQDLTSWLLDFVDFEPTIDPEGRNG